ncbi:MAG TPA: hypothetical protein VIE36_07770 [Methylomirabilota bacterium]|jgi:hypothetical protein
MFRWPTGLLLAAVPPPAAVPAEDLDPLGAHSDALGLEIDAYTSTPAWLGERLDLEWAISVLHPLACRPSRRV